MRKGILTKGITVLLCAVMVLSSGCGKKSEPEIIREKKTISEDDKNYVYSLSELDLERTSDESIEYLCEGKDSIYLLVAKYNESEDDYSTTYSIKKISLTDGTVDEFPWKETVSNAYYNNIACDDAANIFLVKTEYQEDFDEEYSDEETTESSEEPTEDYTSDSTDSTLLLKISSSGEIFWEKPLVDEDKNNSIQSMIYAKDVGIVTASQGGFTVYDPETGEGEMLDYGKNTGDEDFYFDRTFYVLRDGELYLQDHDDDWNYNILKYNKSAKDFEEVENAYPEGVYGGNQLHPGKSYDIYYMDSDALMAYNLGDAESTKICDFTASDLLIDYTRFLFEKDNGNLVIYSSMNSDEMDLYELAKVAPEDVRDKEILVVGTVFISDELRKQVVKFNQLHDDYCIKIKDCFEDSYGDDMEGLAKVTEAFNLDVTSGNAPDIIALSTYIPYESYINKGLIEPLDSYFEQDSDISADDYLPNVFNAGKRNDKLYMIIPSFCIDTVLAAKSMVGDEKVTLMNFRDVCKKNNIDVKRMMGNSNREYTSIYYSRCGSGFIDYEKGTCDFNNPAFINLLEYIKELPSSEDDDFVDYSEYETMFREKKALLKSDYMSSFDDYQIAKKGYFGEDIVFNGYPTTNGAESFIVPLQQLAMSKNCANKEMCWEFLKGFMTDDFQESVKDRKWGFPTSTKVFDEMAAISQEPPFFINSEGKKEPSESYYGIGDIEIKLEELTKEEAEEFSSFIKSVDKLDQSDDKVTEIIDEEVGAFLEGQKTAEEVADIIQSRVSIYLSESM